jgi:hypothetical protein
MLDLRNRYHELTGAFADKRWGEKRLTEEVAALEEKEQKRKVKREEEAKKAALAAERQALIESRGSLDEFIGRIYVEEDDEDTNKFRHALRKAVRAIDNEKEAIAKFNEDLQKNPVYALEWSKGMFEVAAKAAVAREMISAFELGVTYANWKEWANKEALRRARSTSFSTSPTSNLMSSYLTEAWVDVVDSYWD